MDINNLFSNKFIKDAALGTLKKAMLNNNLTACIIKFDPITTELDFEFYQGENVTIPLTDLEYYKNAVLRLIVLEDLQENPLENQLKTQQNEL